MISEFRLNFGMQISDFRFDRLQIEREMNLQSICNLNSAISRDSSSSVDHDDLSGDVAGGVRRQKDRHAFQFSDFADARNRTERLDGGFGQRNGGIRKPRMKKSWCDGVYAD